MEPIKIKDNSPVEKAQLDAVPKIRDGVLNKTLAQLNRENFFLFPETVHEAEDLTEDQRILFKEGDGYQTGNVVGFIGCGDERLVITSRFDKDGNDFFFRYLLEKVLDLPNLTNTKTDADAGVASPDFLPLLFPYYLKNAVRKGIYKQYIRRSYNDSRMSGTLDVARHIRQNTPFLGNIAYHRREFSCDNSLTQLIRHTIEFIRAKPYGNTLLHKVHDEIELLLGATQSYRPQDRQRVIAQNRKNPVRHAFFHEYRSLQRLCLAILQRHSEQLGAGSRQIFGILFDCAWLWEEYVNLLICADFYHPKNRQKEGLHYLFDGKIGHIYPDFIGRNRQFRIIADAKYKNTSSIGNPDYFQVLAYMFRFDAKTGFYLYPEKEVGATDTVLLLSRGTTYEKVEARNDVRLIKHGLNIPSDTADYADFSQQMKKSEQKFLEKLRLPAAKE